MSIKTIKEISSINSSTYSLKEKRLFINYLDTSNITKNQIDEIVRYDDLSELPSRAKRIVNNGDIIISTVRPNQLHYGVLKNIPENLLVSTGFTTITIDKNLADNYYVYYYLTQKHITNYLQRVAEGSTTSYPSIKPSDIGEIVINLPSLLIQRKISKVIRNIEEMIELNKSINNNLEQLSERIFKEWFLLYNFPNSKNLPYKDYDGLFKDTKLGEIPEKWDVVKVGKMNLLITDYVANGSFASLKENVTILDTDDYAYFIRNTDLKSNVFEKYVDKHSYEFLNKSKLFGDEILISNVGDVGSIHLCPTLDKPMTLGNNMIMIRSETELKLEYYLYLLLKSEYGAHLLDGITGGSVQSKFNKTDFRSLKIIMPNNETLKKFNSIIIPIFNQIKEINNEIKKLTKLRDTLLPKLMSGEIDVSNINFDLD